MQTQIRCHITPKSFGHSECNRDRGKTKFYCIFITGDFQEVYRCRFDLARYFQSSGDKWLADHFFNTCLQTSAMVTTDGGKMQAEGYCNVALAQEENGMISSIWNYF